MEAQNPNTATLNYLEPCRAQVRAGRARRFVLGNEAADLDSMASAVALGFHASGAAADPAGLVVPLVNVPRADYRLRTEAVYLFSSVGIEPELLSFIDEVDLDAIHARGELELVLVDHNVLAASQSGLADAVAGVVDHHKDEGGFAGAEPRIIEPVGSAATLVAGLLLGETPQRFDAALAELLLGTILLDTVNLDPEAGRGTAKDADVAARLADISRADREQLFKRLQFEKFNVASLGTQDLLRKDYKESELGELRLGIASVLMPAQDWLEKDPDIVQAIEDFARQRKLDILLAMNAWTDPEFRRALVVWAADPSLQERLVAFLESQDLGLQPIRHGAAGGDGRPAFFAQGNVGCSRKKLLPLLQGFAG
jgi:exopolyphosphatase